MRGDIWLLATFVQNKIGRQELVQENIRAWWPPRRRPAPSHDFQGNVGGM